MISIIVAIVIVTVGLEGQLYLPGPLLRVYYFSAVADNGVCRGGGLPWLESSTSVSRNDHG